jgi:hypothetical protein
LFCKLEVVALGLRVGQIGIRSQKFLVYSIDKLLDLPVGIFEQNSEDRLFELWKEFFSDGENQELEVGDEHF